MPASTDRWSRATMPGRVAGCSFALAALALAVPVTAQDAGYRIRADLGAPLNVDAAWAGAVSEVATVIADRPFRLRMEVVASPAGRLALQVRRNDGRWETLEAHDFPYPAR